MADAKERNVCLFFQDQDREFKEVPENLYSILRTCMDFELYFIIYPFWYDSKISINYLYLNKILTLQSSPKVSPVASCMPTTVSL